MIGMTSVTFRNLEAEEIIEICEKAQIDCIEWGADIHIQPNDLREAAYVRERMNKSSLKVHSYGSYFKVGENSMEEFKSVLETAAVLGAGIIRVWCASKGTEQTTEDEFLNYVNELKQMCRLAKEKDMIVACEYHKDTYNDNVHSALRLINEVNEENYKTYWQTIDYDEKDLEALRLLKKHIAVAHIFTWDKNYNRYDLSGRADMWKQYISEIKNEPIALIMEFVKGDSEEQFLKDAKFLKEITRCNMGVNYDEAAQYCKDNWGEIAEKTIQIADDVCNNKFVFDMSYDLERVDEPTVFEKEIDWFYKKDGDWEFLYQMNRHHYFISLAQAYRFTKNEKYIVKLKELMTDWIEKVKCPENNCNCPWRSLETGLRGEYWTLAVDILKGAPHIDSAFMRMYHESLHTHAKALLKFYTINNYQSNWGVLESHGLFDIGVELNNEEYINTALERLYTQANHQIMADGVHWEQSCLYHNEVLGCFLDVILRAEKNNIKLNDGFIKNVKRLAMVNVAWIKPNRKCPLLGDSDYNDIRAVLTKSAAAFCDGEMKYLAFDNADFDTVWISGADINEKYREIKKVKPAYNSVSLNDSGNFILREDFSENANYLLFHNGYTGAGHAHEDKLSFEFSIGQDDILTDCGRYTYVWNKERAHLKSFKAHNTVSVDNKHFIESDGWDYKSLAPTVKGTFTQNEKFEYLCSSHLGYLNIGENDYVFVNRSIAWLKPDIYLIMDEFDSKGEHIYNQYFNFAPNGKLEIDGSTIKYFSKNSMAYMKLFANRIQLENTVGLYSDHYNEIENTDTVKTTFKGNGKTVAITVLIANRNEKYKNISVERCDVFSDRTQSNLDLPDAFGLKINLDREEHTVILSLKELLWVLFCNGKSASAKITWYKNDEYTAVQW